RPHERQPVNGTESIPLYVWQLAGTAPPIETAGAPVLSVKSCSTTTFDVVPVSSHTKAIGSCPVHVQVTLLSTTAAPIVVGHVGSPDPDLSSIVTALDL